MMAKQPLCLNLEMLNAGKDIYPWLKLFQVFCDEYEFPVMQDKVKQCKNIEELRKIFFEYGFVCDVTLGLFGFGVILKVFVFVVHM